MLPVIDPNDFVNLQDNRSFFVKNLADHIVNVQATPKELAAEIDSDSEKAKYWRSVIKKACDGKAITYLEAKEIVAALERKRAKKAASLPPIDENKVVVGGLFFVVDLGQTCDKFAIDADTIVEAMLALGLSLPNSVKKKHVRKTVEDMMKGSRATLPLARMVVRSVNALLSEVPKDKGPVTQLEETRVISTNRENLRRTPSSGWQLIDFDGTTRWPPQGTAS